MRLDALHHRHLAQRPIGYRPTPSVVRMEEEEEQGRPDVQPLRGRADIETQLDPAVFEKWLSELMHERKEILRALSEGKLSNGDKFRLLDQNRELLVFLNGGSRLKFRTENVIYSILAFSGFMIVVLALLTVYGKLDAHVTTTFVGTVVGGTMATIAQKLGKIGR